MWKNKKGVAFDEFMPLVLFLLVVGVFGFLFLVLGVGSGDDVDDTAKKYQDKIIALRYLREYSFQNWVVREVHSQNPDYDLLRQSNENGFQIKNPRFHERVWQTGVFDEGGRVRGVASANDEDGKIDVKITVPVHRGAGKEYIEFKLQGAEEVLPEITGGGP